LLSMLFSVACSGEFTLLCSVLGSNKELSLDYSAVASYIYGATAHAPHAVNYDNALFISFSSTKPSFDCDDTVTFWATANVCPIYMPSIGLNSHSLEV